MRRRIKLNVILRMFDRPTGPRGWTMICDDGIHPDRPIGVSPIGLGYRVVAC